MKNIVECVIYQFEFIDNVEEILDVYENQYNGRFSVVYLDTFYTLGLFVYIEIIFNWYITSNNIIYKYIQE